MRPEGPEPSPKATVAETALLSAALSGLPLRRVLDNGCGQGRMIPVLLAHAGEYLGLDRDRAIVREVQRSSTKRPGLGFVTADSIHLPFSDASFSAVVILRVFHRFADPQRALTEAHRVLEPGGRLVLLVTPRPSLLTLYRDLWTAWKHPGRFPTISFGTPERTRVGSGTKVGYVETLALTRRRVTGAGFDIVHEYGSGLESLPILRAVPIKFWIRWALSSSLPSLFPSRMIVALRRKNS